MTTTKKKKYSLGFGLVIGLFIIVAAAHYILYHVINGYMVQTHKQTDAIINTLKAHNWDLTALTQSATPDYATWLASPEARELSNNLQLFKNEKTIKLINVYSYSYQYKDNKSTTSFSTLAHLSDGHHIVSVRLISDGKKINLIDNFYVSRNTFEADKKEITALVQSMLTDLEQHKWEKATLKKYLNDDWSEDAIATFGKLSGISANTPISDIGIYTDRGTTLVALELKANPGTVKMAFVKNKNTLKITSFNYKVF